MESAKKEKKYQAPGIGIKITITKRHLDLFRRAIQKQELDKVLRPIIAKPLKGPLFQIEARIKELEAKIQKAGRRG